MKPKVILFFNLFLKVYRSQKVFLIIYIHPFDFFLPRLLDNIFQNERDLKNHHAQPDYLFHQRTGTESDLVIAQDYEASSQLV